MPAEPISLDHYRARRDALAEEAEEDAISQAHARLALAAAVLDAERVTAQLLAGSAASDPM